MEVVLIVDPESLPATLPTFKELMAGYSFQTGNSYAEYRPGDKVAKYGLAALVVGGAAVGAAKLGLFTGLLVFLKKGWKLAVVGLAAVATFFKKLFAKRFRPPGRIAHAPGIGQSPPNGLARASPPEAMSGFSAMGLPWDAAAPTRRTVGSDFP